MPLCHLSIRTLLRNRSTTSATVTRRPAQWRVTVPSVRTYTNAGNDSRKDENRIDLSDHDADNSYLDLILGPRGQEVQQQKVEGYRSPTSPKGASTLLEKAVDYEDTNVTNYSPRKTWRRDRVSSLRTQYSERIPPDESPVSMRPLDPRQGQPQNIIEIQPHRYRKSVPTSTALPQKRLKYASANISWPKRAEPSTRVRYLTAQVQRDLASIVKQPEKHFIRRKYIEAGLSASGFKGSRWWKLQVSRLLHAYDVDREPDSDAPPLLSPGTFTHAERVYDLLQVDSAEAHASISHLVTLRSRWMKVAIWILYYEPSLVLKFLLTTRKMSSPPRVCVADILDFVATRTSHTMERSESRAVLWREIADAYQILKRPSGMAKKRLFMSAFFYHKILKHCSKEQLREFYAEVKDLHREKRPDIFLRFASAFAERDFCEQALDALLEAKQGGIALDSYAFRSTCATVLRRSVQQPGGLRTCIRIVDNLVKVGLPLNAQLSAIIMLNAVEAGDLNTALSIYHSLVDHGLVANEFHYAILLKGAKANIDDAELLNRVIRDAIEHVNVVHTPVLALEIIHCLALHHSKHRPDHAFETVADAYAQLFDTTPLRQLGLTKQVDESQRDNALPPASVVHIMLVTFLEQSYNKTQSVSAAYELYKHVRLLMDAGAEPFVSMAQEDHIYNAFLAIFIRHKKGLLHAAELVKDMQKADSPDAGFKRCKPTVYTWSIFLHGFTRHDQMQLAEQVIKYMHNKGIKPNTVTYNTLARGYAKAQNSDGLLDSLRRMEKDGNTWDEWTVTGIQALIDQRGFQARLTQQKLMDALDFTSDLKKGLEGKISSVEDDNIILKGEREERAKEQVKEHEDRIDASLYSPFS